MDVAINLEENKYAIEDEKIEVYSKGRYAIVDTRDGSIVITSNAWFIVDELFSNGYDYVHTPYKVKRLF